MFSELFKIEMSALPVRKDYMVSCGEQLPVVQPIFKRNYHGGTMERESYPEEDREARWWSEMLSEIEGHPGRKERLLDLVRDEMLVPERLDRASARTVGVKRRVRVEITPIPSCSPNAEQISHLPSTECRASHLQRHKTTVTRAWGGSFLQRLKLNESADLIGC